MAKTRLNGYWDNRLDANETVYVDRVYKKGYVTGFKYLQVGEHEVISPFRATYEELEGKFNQRKYS
ncbi:MULTISPECIES: hypothetical protein [Bacillus amyloliquefaciens group]|uniref:Uncharacterized protein n=1 Tax=Bacillus amyloliquefaciens TaxID=1390 RepID=A0AAP3YFY4_BACAM|nr:MULTISPECIES: hypothetical protein [Bacillus amyloliquefaciens group]ERH59206.1 hypothetical protein O205_00935 [Bacillus amyloliquefaciens EGD-AQ14]MDF4194881.1 hypothetical protein [Bacillus amyloliquefaciens]MDF4213093.1 hypothetical protein [Bacillus amyloliquefaciens]MDH3102762.1 hypothetical protein [Bacillus velezensis]MEE4534988.1 hypothetical protein [Bacillus velezensis]